MGINGQITFAYLSTFSTDTTLKSEAQTHVYALIRQYYDKGRPDKFEGSFTFILVNFIFEVYSNKTYNNYEDELYKQFREVKNDVIFL